MFRTSAAALVLFASTAAWAADATEPVKEIMAAVTANWQAAGTDTDTPPEYTDYFNKDLLGRLYSKDFVAKYGEAAKYPAYDDGDSPFGYDVIAMGQDGCPLKDLAIVAGAAKDGKVPVTATFDNTHCFEGLPEDMKPARVTFETVEEDGKVVIDDIVRHYEEGDQSLKEEMAEIVKFGESGPPPGEEAPPEGEGAEPQQ